MNTREAMQALLEGKKLRHEDWGTTEFIAFAPDGVLRDDGGCRVRSISADDVYELYEEPNPHAKGTFAWAREEAKRGRQLTRKAEKDVYGDTMIRNFKSFSLEDIDATDWEVV